MQVVNSKLKNVKKRPKIGSHIIIKTINGYFKAKLLANGAEYIDNRHNYVENEKILAYYHY